MMEFFIFVCFLVGIAFLIKGKGETIRKEINDNNKEILAHISDMYMEDFKDFIDEASINDGIDRITNDNDQFDWSTRLLSNYIMATSQLVVTKYYDQLKKDYYIGVQKDKYGIENRERFNNTLENVVKNIAVNLLITKVSSSVSSLINVDRTEKDNFLQMITSDIYIDSYIKPFLFDNMTTCLEFRISCDEKNMNSCLSFDDICDGIEYEHAVAKSINTFADGWIAEVSKASGDQGLDIMATSDNGTTVAIQAKFYSSPVGNKAVQEVIAARGYYKTDYAAVVSNSSFTKSACDLALVNNVELLHHNSVVDYFNRL